MTLSHHQFSEIAAQFGTPTYVYHAETISKQYQLLTAAFVDQPVKIFYACKALTNVSILNHFKSLDANIDCSSINEVKLALYAGFPVEKVLYTSNGIGFDEIEEARALGVTINVDSLSNLKKFGEKYGRSYPIGVRFRPNIMAGGNLKIATGHDKSKFGIPIDQLEELLAIVQQYDLCINGLHIHTGSEIKDVDVFVKGIEVLFDIIPYFKELTYIDLGGGFKVAYKKGDAVTDIPLLAKKVGEAFANHPNPNGKPLEIWFEPGKYLVSEAGYFLTEVSVLKQTKNILFASVNSGFNHLIRPMFYESYHHITNISNPTGVEKNYAVVGNICETDTFAWDRKLNEIREGDLLVMANAGAYGFEMSSQYNSRFQPAEVLVKDGQYHLIRKRSDFEDLLRNQIILP